MYDPPWNAISFKQSFNSGIFGEVQNIGTERRYRSFVINQLKRNLIFRGCIFIKSFYKMNITTLPQALLDKIHNHAYDCSAVGMTDVPINGCAQNQMHLSIIKKKTILLN